MAEQDLGIVDAMAQLSFIVQGALAKRASAHDLSIIQTRLLGVLRDREPTMAELARLLDLDKSSATGLVDRAERRGLVRRAPSPDDRRATHVQITPTGRELIDTAAVGFAEDIASATSGLTAADRKRLSVLATKVIAHADATS